MKGIFIDAKNCKHFASMQNGISDFSFSQSEGITPSSDCDLVLSYNGIPTSKHTLPRALEKLAGLAGVHVSKFMR